MSVLRFTLGVGLLAALLSCASVELKDDPNALQDGDGIAYFVIESDTRIRKLLFRSEEADSSHAVFNLSPGNQVTGFTAVASRYCLFEISTPGMSFTNPERLGCFDVHAGASRYSGHLSVENSKVKFRWDPVAGTKAFSAQYPQLFAAYPRH